jgi:hypothetical protein
MPLLQLSPPTDIAKIVQIKTADFSLPLDNIGLRNDNPTYTSAGYVQYKVINLSPG